VDVIGGLKEQGDSTGVFGRFLQVLASRVGVEIHQLVMHKNGNDHQLRGDGSINP
jgi:hypothetical protein